MGKIIPFLIFLLIGCAGLEPEARQATFILFDNQADENVYFVLDGGKHTAVANEQSLYPVEPGEHIVQRAGSASSPETIYVAPCMTETFIFSD